MWNAILSGTATGGVLAARAGWKAAGKSALFGGLALAAIEGLNLVASRVIIPAFEKSQQQAGRVVDKLDPPLDPYHYSKRRTEATPIWDPQPLTTSSGGATQGYLPFGSSGSSSSSSGSGSSSGKWDTPGFGTADDASAAGKPKEEKSWKLW